MVSPRTLVALTQGISKPCLPKTGEDRAREVGKRQQGDRADAGGRLERRLGEGVGRGLGALRRRERTGGLQGTEGKRKAAALGKPPPISF